LSQLINAGQIVSFESGKFLFFHDHNRHHNDFEG
jgi:hypothetical protein